MRDIGNKISLGFLAGMNAMGHFIESFPKRADFIRPSQFNLGALAFSHGDGCARHILKGSSDPPADDIGHRQGEQ